MPKADGPKGSIADQEGDASLPLFPLQTVLFPGGELGLRIFEPRYLDMIARAMREASSFGVVAIRDGTEVGPADFYAVGTTARIEDWSQGRDGILQLRVRGDCRFRVVRAATAPNGLNVSRVDWLAREPSLPLPCRHEHLVRVLTAVLDKLGRHYTNADLDDASWVGYRLAELLDMPLAMRQSMLELDDPLTRLDRLGSRLEE